MDNLPVSLLHECFEANFLEGRLFWKDRPHAHFSTDHGHKVYQSQFPGREALMAEISRHPVNGATGCGGTLTVVGVKHYLRRTRVLWAMHYGQWPALKVGHRNLDPLDDRIENLWEHTPSQQSAFARRTTGKTGVKGVCFTANGKFQASITHLGRAICIGTFRSLDEARIAHNAAAAELHGEFARITGPIGQKTGAAS